MTMTSFLQRMIWRGGDNDRQNVTIAETQCIADRENKKLAMKMSDLLENRSNSVSNIPEVNAGPKRPSTLRLFGNSKKNLSDLTSCQSIDAAVQSPKTPTTRRVEDVVREFEESYKSPTKSPAKRSRNFVKKLVAALERKYRDNEADDVLDMSYSSGPIYAYEQSGTIRKSADNCRKQNKKNDCVSEVAENVAEKSNAKIVQETTTNKSVPKIIGAFLKKPVEVENTSIYWIPITDKKLPRKKSFKKLLARLTGRNGGKRSEAKTKQVVFASQENLIEEIHDSGYEGRSTSSIASSLTSFTETLMYHDNEYVEKEYRDSNFSTFVTSSPMKKSAVIQLPQLVNKSEDSRKMLNENKECSSEVREVGEDSGYISNHSILEESTTKGNLVATRVQQISYQLAKLPKHPFAKSEPRLYQQSEYDHPSCGEIITLRRCRNEEPIYDVPQTRPRSSIFDESLSMKRRNVPIQTVAPFSRSAYPAFANLDDEEQPHYATVKPRNSRTYISYDNLYPVANLDKVTDDEKLSKKSIHSSCADLTANESFVITMYV